MVTRGMKKAVSLLLAGAMVVTPFASHGMLQAAKKNDKTKAKVSSVKITNTGKKLRLQKGKKFNLKTSVKVKPNKSKYKKLKFTSSNRKVVLVNSRGLLKGLRVGTVKITAASKTNPKKKASISVSVTKDVLVTDIKLNKTKITADEFSEEEIQLSVRKILPSNAKNKKVVWSSSDEDVADVSEDGVVTTGNVGTATITATAADKGGAYATCRVTVLENGDQGDDADVTGKPADQVQQPTGQPAVVTEEPVMPPEKTGKPTEQPVDETEEPADVTQAPAEETEEPSDVTQEPTEQPADETEEPADETEEPAVSPEATLRPTKKPAFKTEKPSDVTQEPTEQPADETEEPAVSPEATLRPTKKPAFKTEKPSDVTQAPTRQPAEETEKPVMPPEVTGKPTMSPGYTPDSGKLDMGAAYLDTSQVGMESMPDGAKKLLYTGEYQGIFLDLSDIDFTQYEAIKVTANVPAQISFTFYNKDLDTNEEDWWVTYKIMDFYPFYGGSYEDVRVNGGKGEKPGIETQVFDFSHIPEEELAEIVYLSIGSHDFQEGDYIIYDIEFVEKGQIEPTETPAEETQTPAKTRKLSLTNDNVFHKEDLEDEDGNRGTRVGGTEHADGSITYHTSALNSGGGMSFYANDDRSPLDMSQYSKAVVTMSSLQDDTDMVISFQSDQDGEWGPKDFADSVKYTCLYEAGRQYRIVIDLEKVVANPENKGMDAYGVFVKYNGYNKPDEDATDEEKRALKKTVTIHSIELIAKNSAVATEKPTPTPDPYAPSADGGWVKLDLSQWDGKEGDFFETGDQFVLDDTEFQSVPLPDEPVIDQIGQKVEVLVCGSLAEVSSGFRFWLASEIGSKSGATLSDQYYFTHQSVGIGAGAGNTEKFQTGKPFRIQTVLEHTNHDGYDDTLARHLLIKGPVYGEKLEGVTITGIWVRYGDKIGTTAEVPESTVAPTETPGAESGSVIQTPTVAPTEHPVDYKNPDEAAALKQIIAEQRALGATVSEDLDSDEYKWAGNGNLTEIRWGRVWDGKGEILSAGKKLSGGISFSAFPGLVYLNCAGNQLSSLDVSGNPALTQLWCDDNQLSSLDVSGNSQLEILYCGNNLLDSLDVSGNPALTDLSCDDGVTVTGYKQ